MVKQLTILCLASLLLTACYGYNAPKKPKNLISKTKMVNVLLDLNLINAVPRGENKKKLENNNLITAQYIYKKHGIDSLQFALSNDYYAFYVDDYEAVFKKVKDSLELLKEKHKALLDQEILERKNAEK